MSDTATFVDYNHTRFSEDEMLARSIAFYTRMNNRRSIREFSEEPVPEMVVQNCIRTASTAPSGAHKQPWTFCLISKDRPGLRKCIREAAEAEERESYENRMSEQWLKDLEPFGTNAVKPFIEDAPWLIVVFKRPYEMVQGEKRPNYYVNESVGLACGMLLAAIQNAGLVALTHTPSPMNFLAAILKRPENERPYLLIPVGYPKPSVQVPDLQRKSLEKVLERY